MDQQVPYIVLLGEVGCGKSRIVEKMTGETGRSSDDSKGATRSSEIFWSLNDRLIISDTPGSNSRNGQFEDNIWIATAFNFMPVSKILIVVKAGNVRIDSVISGIREFSDRFIDLPFDPLGVIVTHMDKVEWSEEDCRRRIKENAYISDIVFSRLETPGQTLIENILRFSTEKFNLSVDHENFLSIFQNLHKNTPRKVLIFCKKEVAEFKIKHEEFNKNRNTFEGNHQVDLVFEFLAFMKEEIVEVQKKMQLENDFTFAGEQKYNEAAHIQNLTNQLKSELRKIQVESLSVQPDHQGDLRKCPHCGRVWTKVEVCDGETICGSIPSSGDTLRVPGFAQMASFTFQWNTTAKTLNISQTGSKTVHKHERKGDGQGHGGCGESITWIGMNKVQVTAEFSSTAQAVRMSDVAMLPASAQQFNTDMDGMLESLKKKMVLKPRKNQPRAVKCVVCQDANVQMTIETCGHACVCAACAQTLKQRGGSCPMCRGAISKMNKIFLP